MKVYAIVRCCSRWNICWISFLEEIRYRFWHAVFDRYNGFLMFRLLLIGWCAMPSLDQDVMSQCLQKDLPLIQRQYPNEIYLNREHLDLTLLYWLTEWVLEYLYNQMEIRYNVDSIQVSLYIGLCLLPTVYNVLQTIDLSSPSGPAVTIMLTGLCRIRYWTWDRSWSGGTAYDANTQY